MNWVVEGILDSGGSLNVRNMEVYREQTAEPLAYFLLNIEIDNDPNLWRSLNGIIQGPLHYFDRVILLEQSQGLTRSPIHRDVYTFRKPWLYSLERDFNRSKFTALKWKKPVLSIAFDKSALNKAAIQDLTRSGAF